MNRLGDRLPAPRLPERSRARIERAVFAALDADEAAGSATRTTESRQAPAWRARRGLWVAGAAGGLAVAAVTLLLVTRAPAPSRAAEVIAMRVGGTGTEHVRLTGATIDLDPGGAAVVTGADDRGYVVVLERGRAHFTVEPRSERAPFVVQAGPVRVEVVGTRFEVERVDDRATVIVAQGTVRVLTPEGAVAVPAGGRWPSDGAAAGATGADGGAADTDDHQSPVDDGVIEIEPGDVKGEGADRSETAPAESSPRSTRPRRLTPSKVIGAGPADRERPSTKDLGRTGGAPADARARYEQAAALEARDPEQALREYRAVAAGTGPWAAHALFAAARLELDRGHVAAGRALLEAYAERFPQGPNRDDVRLLLERSAPSSPR
jgi:hypothetical protein